jgi:hypothetical protein
MTWRGVARRSHATPCLAVAWQGMAWLLRCCVGIVLRSYLLRPQIRSAQALCTAAPRWGHPQPVRQSRRRCGSRAVRAAPPAGLEFRRSPCGRCRGSRRCAHAVGASAPVCIGACCEYACCIVACCIIASLRVAFLRVASLRVACSLGFPGLTGPGMLWPPIARTEIRLASFIISLDCSGHK